MAALWVERGISPRDLEAYPDVADEVLSYVREKATDAAHDQTSAELRARLQELG